MTNNHAEASTPIGFGATALSCLLVLFALLACKSDVTAPPPGSYQLDVDATKAAWEKKSATLPENERALQRMGMGLLSAMTVDMTLAEGGTMSGSTSIRLDQTPPVPQPMAGSWTLAGSTVTLTFTQPSPEVNTCNLAGSSLECSDAKGGVMVYSRK